MPCTWRSCQAIPRAKNTIGATRLTSGGLFVLLSQASQRRFGRLRAAILIPFLWTGLEYFRSELCFVFKQAKSVPIEFFQDGRPAAEQRLWHSPWGNLGICICYDLSYSRVTA